MDTTNEQSPAERQGNIDPSDALLLQDIEREIAAVKREAERKIKHYEDWRAEILARYAPASE